MPYRLLSLAVALSAFALPQASVEAQRTTQPAPAQRREGNLAAAPNRRPDEGKGPYKTMVIRGVMLIDGTGAPPQGPVDITVEGNRIASIRSAGTAGLPAPANSPPQGGDYELDATGMYLMPGFVDMHVHAGGAPKNDDAEYTYKLWLAHGVTTVRGVPMASNDITVKEKERSARNEIVAPRIVNYQRPGSGWDKGAVTSPELARQVRAVGGSQRHRWLEARRRTARHHGGTARRGEEGRFRVDGSPAAGRRRADERDQGRPPRSEYRHPLLRPLRVAVEGLCRAAVAGGHERERRAVALRPGCAPVRQDAEPGSPEWKAYLQEHLKLGTVFDPTFTIYSAGRDLMRSAPPSGTTSTRCRRCCPTTRRAARTTAPTGTTGRPRTKSRGVTSIRCGSSFVNDYKKMGGRDHRFGFGVHLPDVWLRVHRRARDAAGGRLPSSRSDPGGNDERRRDARGTEAAVARVRHRPRRHARRHGHRRSEPARELQGPLRDGRSEAERQDSDVPSRWAASSTRSRTASFTTRSSCLPTSRRWWRSRSAPAGERPSRSNERGARVARGREDPSNPQGGGCFRRKSFAQVEAFKHRFWIGLLEPETGDRLKVPRADDVEDAGRQQDDHGEDERRFRI